MSILNMLALAAILHGLFTTVTAQASGQDAVTSATASASSPVIMPESPFLGPFNSFHFLSPQLDYYPPEGAWRTNMRQVYAANDGGNSSVSVGVLASGVRWRFSGGPVTLLVNGSSPEALNGTVEINDRNATVSGLAYEWYNFTIVTGGLLDFQSVIPVMNGSQWLPAERDLQVAINSSSPSSLITTSGEWVGDYGFTTNSPGATMTIFPPEGTALLELTQNSPSAPAPPFNVSIDPPPPQQPANQSFTGSLYPADQVLAIGIINVPMLRLELDPKVKYTVNVLYAGNGTETFRVHHLGTYTAKAEHGGAQQGQQEAAAPTSAAKRTVPILFTWPMLAVLVLHALLR